MSRRGTFVVECRHAEVVEPLVGRLHGPDGARAAAEQFANLADPSRARIHHLPAVSGRGLRVCDMALVIGMSVSALSQRPRRLRERGAVERRKAGRVAYDRLTGATLDNGRGRGEAPPGHLPAGPLLLPGDYIDGVKPSARKASGSSPNSR